MALQHSLDLRFDPKLISISSSYLFLKLVMLAALIICSFWCSVFLYGSAYIMLIPETHQSIPLDFILKT
jgi:predicted membrane protein